MQAPILVEWSLINVHSQSPLSPARASPDRTFGKNRDQLNEALDLMRLVVDHIGAGVIISDEQGNLAHWNPAALRLHGFDGAADIGRKICDFTALFEVSTLDGVLVHNADWPIMRLLRGEAVEDWELCVRRLDTRQSWIISFSGTSISAAGRQLFVLTLQDLTAQKQSQRRLRNKQQLLRTLLEGINDPVYVKNAAGQYMFVNSALSQLADRTPEECIDKNSIEVFGQTIGQWAQEADRKILQQADALTYEESLDLAGQMHHYLITKCRFLNADGAVGGLFGISRDITSLKQAEQAIRASAVHLRQVIDSLPVIVVVLATNESVVDINRTAREAIEVSGSAVESLIGRKLTALPLCSGTPEQHAAMADCLAKALSGHDARLSNVEMSFGFASGTYDVAFAPMHDAGGVVDHVIFSAIDVTERKLAEKKAREQQAELAHLDRVRTMEHMASGLAHELNQPLGAITNYAAACRHLIKNEKTELNRFDEAFASIVAEAARAGEIIRRLRTFVRKQQPLVALTDLGLLVQDALRILAFDFRQAGVVATLAVPANLPKVMVDPIQISQVLVNLFRNAADAMVEVQPDRRRLAIDVKPADDGLIWITVTDQGVGVAKESLPRLFDAFYTTKANGLGIGLALCRMIVENHGGQISAKLNPEGGMTFTLAFVPSK